MRDEQTVGVMGVWIQLLNVGPTHCVEDVRPEPVRGNIIDIRPDRVWGDELLGTAIVDGERYPARLLYDRSGHGFEPDGASTRWTVDLGASKRRHTWRD